MSVDYLLVLVVCQATFVQPDGITLPFTSLTYKSFPTNPKENLSSLENSGNAASPTKTDNVKNIEVNASKTSFESPLQQSLLKSIIPTNCNNASFRTNLLDVQTKPREQIERHIKIHSSSLNIATTQASKLSPTNILNEGSNNIKENSISYLPKTRPPSTPANYLETSKNNHVVNLESSLNIGLSDMPHSTYKANQMNIQTKYLDCSKQTNLEFERNSLNQDIQKLENPKFLPDWENIQKDNLNKIKDNIGGSDVISNIQLLQAINREKDIEKISSCKENIQEIEKPNSISKVLYPIDDIIFNSVSNLANANQVINAIQAETTGEKIYNNSNFAYNRNNVELIDTPSIKFRSDKVNSIPCNAKISNYEIINNIAIAEPVSPLNYAPSQIPLYGIYPYGAKEISLPGLNVSPASSSSVYKVPDTYNYIKDEMISSQSPGIVTKSSVNVPDFNSNNSVMTKYIGIDYPNIIPSISATSNPARTMEVPALSQLPRVCTPEITFPQPLSSHVVLNPTNVIYNDVPDIPCVNSLDNRFPTSIRPNVDHTRTLVRSNENLNSLIPLLANIDNIPPYQPKSINQNYVKPTYVFTPVKNNQANVRHSENVNPVTLQRSPENIPCPSKSTVTKKNLYSSPLTESLNNIISYFTTGLLSAFFDLNTKSDEPVSLISTDCPIIANIENDSPSCIYSVTSISEPMPLFMLNPPQLPSPTSLPTPNVLPLKDCDNKSLLKRKPVVKKPKAYISSITINLTPSNEVNDIMIFM